MSANYRPDSGDLVWLTFDPQAGREQAGRRPAIVLSAAQYNGRTGLALACPITSRSKGYPFEVALPAGCGVSGVILVDQVKSVDWQVRQIELAGHCPRETADVVRAKLVALIEC